MTLAFLLIFGLTFFGFTLFSLLDLLSSPAGDGDTKETARFTVNLLVKAIWMVWLVALLAAVGNSEAFGDASATRIYLAMCAGFGLGLAVHFTIEQKISGMRRRLRQKFPFVPWYNRKEGEK